MGSQSLSELLSRYRTGHSPEQAFYTDAGVFSEEMNKIHRRQWLYAGPVARISTPGDYFLFNLQEESVIIIRGDKGEIHAHYNTCTHRGSAICLEPEGHVQKLMCPYHQWVFNRNGSLLAARMMPDDFKKDDHHLRAVAVEVVEGLIFICLSSSPPDFNTIRERLTPYLKPFGLASAKVALVKPYRLRTNWKLVAENFRECYHCGGAHPEYCSAVIGANLKEDVTTITAEKAAIWSSKGLETKLFEVTPGTTTYAVRYPLRPGVESYSTDGKAVSVPMGDHRDHDAGVVGLVNYPNFWMDGVSDYVWIMRVDPVSASETITEFCWLVAGNAVAGKDYDLARLTEFWEKTGEQDARLCENNYRGILTSGYRSGPYAPSEDQVVNFVEWWIDQLRS
ncbi:MAG: aromatic ring-hydroxylating oxygenase subunit alpha [Bacteroidota bacterium]